MKCARIFHAVWLLAGSALLSAAPVVAQADDWLAWQGCWQAGGAPAGEFLCIVPDVAGGAVGVRMITVADGAIVAESRVITDGRARRVQTEGCDGSEVAFWSADYHRVFLNSELSCEAGVTRQASGVFAITGTDSWLSVQAVTIDGRTATRTVSYAAVTDAAAPATVRSALRRSVQDRMAARIRTLSPINAEDVNEAVERIDAAAVQEWLSATGQPFQLADDFAPVVGDVVTRSALDHTGYFTQHRPQSVREVVHVVERPVYVTHTHVHEYRYRTCWDPFFSGVVIGLGSVRIGVGHAHCGRSYLTHYSPWGYDLYGWRFVHTRPIVIDRRPIIHYREPSRPRRVIYTAPRDDERRAPVPRLPTRPRPDEPVRTAQPRVASPETGRPSTPTRTAEPRRSAQPSRSQTSTLSQPQRNSEPPQRSATPRGSTLYRTPAPPTTSPAATPRLAQPRTVTAPRPPVTPPPRTVQRPATSPPPSEPRPTATPPLRQAKPRGGEH